MRNHRSCEHNFENNRSEKIELSERIIGNFWSIIDLSLDPAGPLSFQLKLFETLMMHTLLLLTESTNPGGARGGECKQ